MAHAEGEPSLRGQGHFTPPLLDRAATQDVVAGGSGINASPFGVRRTLLGGGDSCATCLDDGDPVLLGSGEVTGPAGTALEELVAAGAWSSADGHEGGSLLGSGLEVQAELVGSGAGLGLQAWP